MATQVGWNITSTQKHERNSSALIPQQSQHDDRSGFCHKTRIYNSLHKLGPNHQIPTQSDLHTAKYVLSHFPNPPNHNAESRIALIDSLTDHRLTYGQLRHNVHSLAAALHHAIGIHKNDVVFLLSPNSLLYPTICLAVLSIGAVLTTANPLNTAQEIAKQVRDSGAKVAISAPNELHKLIPTGVPTLITTRSSQNNDNDNGKISIEELIECGDPSQSPETRILQTDTAAILYSSGTTGVSKGVVLTHANLISVMTLLKWTIEVSSAQDDVFLCFIPMFHVYGLVFFALGLFCVGATIVVMPRFDFQSMLDAIEKYRINNLPAVPPVILGLVRSVGEERDMSALRRVGSGAAALGKEVAERFREKYPWVELRDGYGLTESGGATTYFVSDEDAREREGSVGQLLPGFSGRIVDLESGEGLGPNRQGELWVSSGTVMKGYLGNEEATRVTVDEQGWLRTGDLGYIDEDGFIYIVDRIKELIKHNGYQVAPAELEAVLLSHPLILDAAVIPVDDEGAGQIPMACVVRSAESELTEDQVIQFVASQVAPYKKVRKVSFISSIPRSASGKILRKELVSQSPQLFSKL